MGKEEGEVWEERKTGKVEMDKKMPVLGAEKAHCDKT